MKGCFVFSARRMDAAQSDRDLKTFEAETARQMEENRSALIEVRNRNVVAEAQAGAVALTDGAPRYTVPFPRDTRSLLFAVREPWESRWTGVTLTHGRVPQEKELTIHSEMADGGAISSDGVLEDAIDFNAGTTVTISVAARAARLITP